MSTRSDNLACTSVRSNGRDHTSSVAVVGKHASRVDCIGVASLFHLVCGCENGRVGSNTCKQIGNARSQMEDVNGFGLRLLVETLHLLLPQT